MAVEESDDDLPRPGKVWEGPSLGELLKEQARKDADAGCNSRFRGRAREGAAVSADDSDAAGLWRRLIGQLHDQGSSLVGILSMANCVSVEDGTAIIRFQPQGATFAKMLSGNGKKDTIAKALLDLRGTPIGVRFEVAAEEEPKSQPAASTPARGIPGETGDGHRSCSLRAPGSFATAPVRRGAGRAQSRSLRADRASGIWRHYHQGGLKTHSRRNLPPERKSFAGRIKKSRQPRQSGDMMKQARQMQEKMKTLQEEMGRKQITAEAGAGMVQAVVNGKLELVKIRIDKSKIDVNDTEMLEDVITAAVNAAQVKAADMMRQEMQKVTAEMGLPPGMLP